jgi:chaperonin GroES
MAKIEPLDDRVVVERLEQDEKTAGGIFLPDSAKEKPQQGKIVALGPGRMLDAGERAPMSVQKGDVVLFAKYGGTEVEIDGKELLIMRESDLLAVVEG